MAPAPSELNGRQSGCSVTEFVLICQPSITIYIGCLQVSLSIPFALMGQNQRAFGHNDTCRGSNHYEKIVISPILTSKIRHYDVMPVYYDFWK